MLCIHKRIGTVMTQNKKLPFNVLHAIDAVKASGGIVPTSTIDLMLLVDSGEITDDEAIEKIIDEENLSKIEYL